MPLKVHPDIASPAVRSRKPIEELQRELGLRVR